MMREDVAFRKIGKIRSYLFRACSNIREEAAGLNIGCPISGPVPRTIVERSKAS